MNQSIYTERENILPHHAEWLDGCGAKWVDGTPFSDYRTNKKCLTFSPNGFGQYTNILIDSDFTYIPTGTEFCERVAEILGIPKPTFEVESNMNQIKDTLIPKFEVTTTEPFIDDMTNDGIKLGGYETQIAIEDMERRAQEDIEELIKTFSHKTYRILDSLDGIPLDTRFKLSEWIPPYNEELIFVNSDYWCKGFLVSIKESYVNIQEEEKSKLTAINLDGKWMRIV